MIWICVHTCRYLDLTGMKWVRFKFAPFFSFSFPNRSLGRSWFIFIKAGVKVWLMGFMIRMEVGT